MMMSASAAASTKVSAPSAKYQGRPEDFPSLDGMPPHSSQPTTADESRHPKSNISENPNAESAPRAGMSLAKKLAMSNRLSVRNGPMDFSDFPSLSNSRAPRSRKGPPVSEEDFPSLSRTSKAELGKMSTASAWNTTDKSSTCEVQPSSRAGKLGDDGDFPSLTSTAAATDKSASLPANSSSLNSLADISRNFSSSSLSKLSDRADTEVSNPPGLSWGPELSHKSDNLEEKETKERDNLLRMKMNKSSGKSTLHEAWSGNGGRQTSGQISDHVKQAATSSNISIKPAASSAVIPEVAPAETTTGEHDKVSKDASTADGPDWTRVGSEKKIQSKPSKKNDAKLQTDKAKLEQVESRKVTKSKAQSEDGSSQSKNGKDKSKKKQKTNKAQRESTVEKTGLNDAAKQSCESDVVDRKTGAEKGDTDVPRPSETLETLDGRVPGGSDELVTSIEKLAVSERSPVLNDESVPGVDDNPKADTTQPSVSTAVPVFCAADFPSLAVQNFAISSLPSLPPGFSNLPVSSSKPPPPPGFGNPVVSSCPAPGLNSLLSSAVVSDANAVGKTGEVYSEVSMSAYIPPRDMQQRSAKLVGFISDAVKDSNFGEFRELSEKFRAGTISAGAYHSSCRDVMDSTAFLSIFPELIALLPDLPKQNQLLKVHRDFLSKTPRTEKVRSWCTAPEDGLVSCVVCGQVLCHSDLQDHASEHGTFNAEYPTLSSTSLCSVR